MKVASVLLPVPLGEVLLGFRLFLAACNDDMHRGDTSPFACTDWLVSTFCFLPWLKQELVPR